MTERYGYLEGGELKPADENAALRWLAKGLQGVSKGADLFGEYSPTFALGKKAIDWISPPKPEEPKEFGGGLGETLGLAGAARETKRWSQGDSPVQTPTLSRGVIPRKVDLERGFDVADAASTLFPPAKAYGRLAKDAAQSAIEQAGTAGRAYAVKPPGGYFHPNVKMDLQRSLGIDEVGEAGAGPEGQGQPQYEILRRLTDRWINRHLGTINDPAKNIQAAEGATLENLTDRALRERAIPLGNLPDYPGAQAGNTMWEFNRTAARNQLDDFMTGFGDWARAQEPAVLNRGGLGEAMKRYAREQGLADRQARNVAAAENRRLLLEARNRGEAPGAGVVAPGEAPWSTEEIMSAARRITEQHPGGPWMESPRGNWYKFDRNTDPDYIKQSLSLDSCIGDNCIATAGMGVDKRFPGFSPLIDPVSGNPTRVRGGGLPPNSPYIEGVADPRTENQIYSFRTPTHRPIITMHTSMVPGQEPTGAPRGEVIRRISRRDYDAWQQEQQQWNVAEQPIAVNREGQHIGRVRAGRGAAALPAGEMPAGAHGMRSPRRPPLTVEQVVSLIEKYPQHREKLAQFIEAPPPMRDLRQAHGLADRGPGLAYSPEFARALSRLGRENVDITSMRRWGARGGVVSGQHLPVPTSRFHPWQEFDPNPEMSQTMTPRQANDQRVALEQLIETAGRRPAGYPRSEQDETEAIRILARHLRALRGDVLPE